MLKFGDKKSERNFVCLKVLKTWNINGKKQWNHTALLMLHVGLYIKNAYTLLRFVTHL